MSRPEPRVVAVIATLNRPAEVRALLASFAECGPELLAVVMVDNGANEETRQAVEESSVRTVYHRSERNLGCGGGLLVGERLALERFGEELTHLWITDDDVVVYPETLRTLLDALAATGAVAACPLVEDSDGLINFSPGLRDPAKYRISNKRRPQEEYLRLCGPDPVPFSWTQGIALLVTRAALDQHGLHRTDFWVRGEDLDFSLRLTYHALGVWVPRARVRHLPPSVPWRTEAEYVRSIALLQNVAYLGLRQPHGRRIARTIPGNSVRFLQRWGWTPRVFWDVLRAFWHGSVRGWPAGRTYGRAQAAGRG